MYIKGVFVDVTNEYLNLTEFYVCGISARGVPCYCVIVDAFRSFHLCLTSFLRYPVNIETESKKGVTGQRGELRNEDIYNL